MLEAVKEVEFTIIELELQIERVKKSVVKLSNRFQDTQSNDYPFPEEVSMSKEQGMVDTINGLYKEVRSMEEICENLKIELEEFMQI